MAECKRCGGSKQVTEYSVTQPFNPHSAQQVMALIKHLGLKVPIKRGEDRETSEAKYLKRFAKKHPIFASILECRAREKLITTYLWKPRADGRIGTQYGFHPSTWRKSSRGKGIGFAQLQTIPKRGPLARPVRKCVVAAPHHLLIEADSSAIEAVLVGFCAGDRDYIRLAKLGVHDFVTANWLGQTVDLTQGDEALRALFQEVKAAHKDEREAAKRGVHGSNYLLTPYGLADEYAEYFPSRKGAAEFQEFYFGLFPKLRTWHSATLERASKETYLENHYQYRHYFYSVFSWDHRRQQWVLGDDAKRAVAFVPQSDASAIQTEDILTLDAMPEVSPHLRLIIHDSVVLEVPEAEVERVASLVHRVMARPRPELGGLAIGAEVSVGPNLGEMEKMEINVEVECAQSA